MNYWPWAIVIAVLAWWSAFANGAMGGKSTKKPAPTPNGGNAGNGTPDVAADDGGFFSDAVEWFSDAVAMIPAFGDAEAGKIVAGQS